MKSTTYIRQKAVIVTIKNIDLDAYLSDYDETGKAGNLAMLNCNATCRTVLETQARVRGVGVGEYLSKLVIQSLQRDTLRLAIQH